MSEACLAVCSTVHIAQTLLLYASQAGTAREVRMLTFSGLHTDKRCCAVIGILFYLLFYLGAEKSTQNFRISLYVSNTAVVVHIPTR